MTKIEAIEAIMNIGSQVRSELLLKIANFENETKSAAEARQARRLIIALEASATFYKYERVYINQDINKQEQIS